MSEELEIHSIKPIRLPKRNGISQVVTVSEWQNEKFRRGWNSGQIGHQGHETFPGGLMALGDCPPYWDLPPSGVILAPSEGLDVMCHWHQWWFLSCEPLIRRYLVLLSLMENGTGPASTCPYSEGYGWAGLALSYLVWPCTVLCAKEGPWTV